VDDTLDPLAFYPKSLYHLDGRGLVVQNPDEELAALTAGWLTHEQWVAGQNGHGQADVPSVTLPPKRKPGRPRKADVVVEE